MKTNRRPFIKLAACATLLACVARVHAIAPDEWRTRQSLEVPSAGLTRVALPPETLDAARPGLEDLRLLDPAGNEVPFLIERPVPLPGSIRRAKDFRCAIENEATILTVETGTTEPLAGVSLETPGSDFLKPVRVEGSHDGTNWQELAKDQPVFRLPRGAEKLRIQFAESAWEFLRLTIDDRRAQPVPFTGAQLFTPGSGAPSKGLPVTIKSREENPGITRLELDLGAANLPLASLQIETPEPLFTRTVTVAVPEVTESGIIEQVIGQAVIYKIGIDGKNEAKLIIPLEKQIRSRAAILTIRNEDSPPLPISDVRAVRRLNSLTFLAREPGRFTLLAGNNQCPAARYDLSALALQLKSAAAVELNPAPLSENSDFKAPETLGSLNLTGSPLDTAGWKFRKTVQFSRPGVQQLELDSEVLAETRGDTNDLRLVREKQQLPYLIDRPPISRAIALNASPDVDLKKPSRSRWSIKLPHTAIPLTRLVCNSSSELFQRDMQLWEEVTDEWGDKYSRELGRAIWKQTPGHSKKEFVIEFNQTPVTDRLFLETDNGDNTAIELHDFRCYYPVVRLVFKAAPDASNPLWLYYGNRNASAPRYDLSLVANQILRAEKSIATAGSEEPTSGKASKQGTEETPFRGGILFWGALAIVVIALLFLVARLLPKTEEK